MDSQLTAVIIIGALAYLLFVYRLGPSNTETIVVEGKNYNVHHAHADGEKAALILREITRRNRLLIKHLREKYLVEHEEMHNPYGAQLGESLFSQISQLCDRYNEDRIFEISPLNYMGYTSYTENKGEKMVFCLRQKKPVKVGGVDTYPLHDINTLMFVDLHELTHIMTREFGHQDEFWRNFKFILQEAVELGIYDPVDYRQNPINYCGLDVYHNPLFE